MRVLVKDIQGPLEEGWETKGKSFVDMIETGTAGHVT
jgi:hypothetical protein